MPMTSSRGLAPLLAASLALPAVAAETRPPAPTAADAKPVADAKPADGAPAAPAPVADLPERVIEKKDGPYIVRIVVRPGNLKPGRTAEISTEILKVLEIPDPVSGNLRSIASAENTATVTPPAPEAPPEPPKGKKAPPAPPPPVPTKHQLWPAGKEGNLAFHFTPAADGLYDLAINGFDPKPYEDSETGRTVEVHFKVGVGAAAGQTEVSQGAASVRRSSRRAVGGSGSEAAAPPKLPKLMKEVGHRFLELESALAKWPEKGANADAVAAAKALSALFAETKGTTPESMKVAAEEFEKLSAGTAAALDQIVTLAGTEVKAKERGANAAATRAAFEKLETQSCQQCHAKFRWGVTTDLSAWPKFEQKPWKK